MPTKYMYVWWVNLADRNHLEDLCVVGRIILKLIIESWDVAQTEMGQIGGYCDGSSKRQASVICGEFLEYLRTV
jgi:hypothetical protein